MLHFACLVLLLLPNGIINYGHYTFGNKSLANMHPVQGVFTNVVTISDALLTP